MDPPFIMRMYSVWDREVSVSPPAQSASTTPQNVGVFVRVTIVANCLIPSAVKVRQNVSSGKHVVLSWKLHILAELSICPSKVWACHRHEISYAADNATVTLMETQGKIRVAIKRPRTRSAAARHWHDLSLSAYERDHVTNEQITLYRCKPSSKRRSACVITVRM